MPNVRIVPLDAVAQETRLENQAKQDALITQAKTLEALLKYVASEKPTDRAFGYAMFAALGKGDLAATLIGTTRDQAGATVVKGLVNSSDPKIAQKATSALLTLDQQSRLVGAVALMARVGEKSGYEYLQIADSKSHINFGIDLWPLPSFGTDWSLKILLNEYAKEPGALYINELKNFNESINIEDPKLVGNISFHNFLQKTGTDPAMIKVQERLLMSSKLEPILRQASELGTKTALGAAMVFYLMYANVEEDIRDIITKTEKSSKGSLRDSLYKVVPGASPRRVVFDKAEGLLGAFLDAAAALVRLGADGITTTCGFLSLYQREIAAHVEVPVATSSLMQIPLIERLLPPKRRVGVLTISAASLTRAHLVAAGADPDTPVIGTDDGSEFTRAILNDEARLDAAAAERDILDAGNALVARHPATGAVLLECTNMVPYARALSEHLRLPVFSIYSFVTWFQAGLVPRDFGMPGSAHGSSRRAWGER